ncbi:hypothetical protein [Caballeronia sp. GAFFF1]|uniref:hypothetical protein n=1 Tax=Caballeronia sp. GAFFF1 TaxID=2921779 RepID=UPI002027BD85|nr:hypothetical protein [Caballeronia sp. GAFFF1]
MASFKHLLTIVLSCACFVTVTAASANVLDDDSQTPGALAEKAGENMLDEIRRSGTDRQRWSSLYLFSDGDNPKSLRMPLVRSANFFMRLDPKHDLLYFEKPGLLQTFDIPGKSRGIKACPDYSIRVISASPKHAVVLQMCTYPDAPPGKAHSTSSYYLYDMKTATMINIWYSGDQVRKVPLAFVPPDPIVTTINNGYRVDWHYNDRTVTPPDVVDLHVTYRYVQDSITKENSLVCKDLTNTQHLEGDMCSTVVNMDLKAISNRSSDTIQ